MVQVKTEQHNEYEEETTSLQVGAIDTKWRRLAKPQRGHFYHAGVTPKKVLMEFKVSPDAVLPPGALPLPEVGKKQRASSTNKQRSSISQCRNGAPSRAFLSRPAP